MKIENVFEIQFSGMYMFFVNWINKYIFHKNAIFSPCETILATFPMKMPLYRLHTAKHQQNAERYSTRIHC